MSQKGTHWSGSHENQKVDIGLVYMIVENIDLGLIYMIVTRYTLVWFMKIKKVNKGLVDIRIKKKKIDLGLFYTKSKW